MKPSKVAAPLADRLRSTASELNTQRLQTRFANIDITSIASVPERTPVRFGGEVRSQHRASPEGRPLLQIEIADGTGVAVALFTGRRRIHGFDVGRAVVFEGVARRQNGKLLVQNPGYTLLDGATSN